MLSLQNQVLQLEPDPDPYTTWLHPGPNLPAPIQWVDHWIGKKIFKNDAFENHSTWGAQIKGWGWFDGHEILDKSGPHPDLSIPTFPWIEAALRGANKVLCKFCTWPCAHLKGLYINIYIYGALSCASFLCEPHAASLVGLTIVMGKVGGTKSGSDPPVCAEFQVHHITLMA